MSKRNPTRSVPVHRSPIPVLESRNMRIGSEGQIRRSWPMAPGEFLRLYSDDTLHLDLEFREGTAGARAALCTNLLTPEGTWGEIEFKRIDRHRFALDVAPARCGLFQFKLKYSPRRGAEWFWDRTPFTKVLVDPAAARDVRLYTFLPSVSGHIGRWKRELARIRDLGFNRIHLLPITRLDVSKSPYAAADLFDPDPSYLDPADSRSGLDQFEDFVAEARDKGLGLCLDLVLNHVGCSSLIANRKPEWLVPDPNEDNGLLRAGCWHMNKWIKWGDLVRIYYDHPEPKVREELWNYMKGYALFWANYASQTGGMVRLDNLHASHPEFIASLLSALRSAYPDLIVQAEYFSDSNTLLKTASESDINLFLANPWEYPYAEGLREYLVYLHGISPKIRFLTPVTTHDTGAPAELYGGAEAVVPRYFILALMTTGQTGLTQGAEHGAARKIAFIGRSGTETFDTPDRFSAVIRRINEIHGSFSLFHKGGNITFVDDDNGALIAALREDCGERFLLIANLDIARGHWLDIPSAAWRESDEALVLHDLIEDQRVPVDGDVFHAGLPPCGVRAYRFERMRG